MIKSLDIQNYQSHKDTHLDFHKGVNIIVGTSDSGKSAIIRTIKWVKDNRPSGDAIRSSWGGKTEVSIVLDAPELEIDPEITRIKDKQDEYIMNGMTFKAFRTEVPKEITDVLNMTEINLSNQLDIPFLIANSAGEVAQHFNQIAKLHKIDSATSNINSAIRSLTSEKTFKEGQVKKYEGELIQYEHLEKFEVDVEILEDLEKRFVNLCNRTNKLKSILEDLFLTEEDIEVEQETLKLEPLVNSILDKYEIVKELDDNYNELQNLLENIKQDDIELDEYKALVSLEHPVNNLLDLHGSLNEAETERNKLSKLLSNINNVQEEVISAEERYRRLKVKFEDEMGTTCILCGSKLK